MSGIVDAVARAIAGAHTPLAKWDGRSPEAQEVFRGMAVAAINAMGGVEPPLALTGEGVAWALDRAIGLLERDDYDAEAAILRALLARATTTGEGARGTHG